MWVFAYPCTFNFPSVYLSSCLSTCLLIHLCVHLFVCRSICPSLCLSVSVCLSATGLLANIHSKYNGCSIQYIHIYMCPRKFPESLAKVSPYIEWSVYPTVDISTTPVFFRQLWRVHQPTRGNEVSDGLGSLYRGTSERFAESNTVSRIQEILKFSQWNAVRFMIGGSPSSLIFV